MPCNFGFKSYAKVVIPEPQPEAFRAEVEGPKIDAELLEKLGNEEPEFLEWLSDLDAQPLLAEALKRTLTKIKTKGVKFTVRQGDGKRNG